MTLNADQTIQLLGQMSAARSLIQRSHPHDWRLRIKAATSVIHEHMKEGPVSFMAAGARMIKRMLDNGDPPGAIALVMAACMEHHDPTPA
jgi:hypothetical protein